MDCRRKSRSGQGPLAAATLRIIALADLVAGGRQVRLGLGSIPFGFQGPAHRGQVVAAWEKVLRDAA
jgi:hypothetical protein